MLVTEFTGSASILRRPPVISSTEVFQSVNIVWKMSFCAQPDWIFQVIVGAAVAVAPPTPPPAAGVAAPPPAGAFCCRQAAMNAPRPESDKYLRNPRRELLSGFTLALPFSRPSKRVRDNSMPRVSPCQERVFAW